MADKNRDQWRNPYDQDWGRNESRYRQDQYNQQRNRELGNVNYDRNYNQIRRNFNDYNQGYGSDPWDNENRKNYRTSEEWGSNRNIGGSNRGNYSSGNYRENEYGGGYGNSYGTFGAFGNMEGDWDRRDEDRRRYNREGNMGNIQRSSFGEQGYYGADYDRSNYDRRAFDKRDYDRRDYNRNQIREDRSWWDKTTDEVSSWFGDDEAERRRERDKQMAGQHRGKGPKGYSRSDERIREDISDRLSDDDYVDASDIDVQVNGSEVILTGTVDSREAKRRAEDIAERISGVKNVENRLRVGTERLSVGGSTTNITTNTSNRSTNI